MSESVQVFQTVLLVVYNYTFDFVIKFSCGPIQHLRFPCTSTDSRVNKAIDLLNEGLSYDFVFVNLKWHSLSVKEL